MTLTPDAKRNYLKKYELYGLKLIDSAVLNVAYGAKSVSIDSMGEKVYCLNLESLSIMAFQRTNRTKTDEYQFYGTPAQGYDYQRETQIPSFEEKPVEACFSHHDSLLWVSLHNSGGIVPIPIKPINFKVSYMEKFIKHKSGKVAKRFQVPIVPTGKTPKTIAKTSDDRWLLVSNWHSKSITALRLGKASQLPIMQSTLITEAIPRGIVVDDDTKIVYIAEMGSNRILRWDLTTFKSFKPFTVKNNPRHLVLHRQRLFCSFNKIDSLACYDKYNGDELFSCKTQSQPRTIAITSNGQYLFLCCYEGNVLEVFEVKSNSFEKRFNFKCPGNPVGLAIHEDETVVDVWVCTYSEGRLHNFRFCKT